jgi:hypothetical protein
MVRRQISVGGRARMPAFFDADADAAAANALAPRSAAQ